MMYVCYSICRLYGTLWHLYDISIEASGVTKRRCQKFLEGLGSLGGLATYCGASGPRRTYICLCKKRYTYTLYNGNYICNDALYIQISCIHRHIYIYYIRYTTYNKQVYIYYIYYIILYYIILYIYYIMLCLDLPPKRLGADSLTPARLKRLRLPIFAIQLLREPALIDLHHISCIFIRLII